MWLTEDIAVHVIFEVSDRRSITFYTLDPRIWTPPILQQQF